MISTAALHNNLIVEISYKIDLPKTPANLAGVSFDQKVTPTFPVIFTFRFFGNFRARYPDFGVQACVRTPAPQNPDFFTPNLGEPTFL